MHTALGATAALASTGKLLDAVLGGGVWFVIATGVVALVRRTRRSDGLTAGPYAGARNSSQASCIRCAWPAVNCV
jgi:hypothetical protein